MHDTTEYATRETGAQGNRPIVTDGGPASTSLPPASGARSPSGNRARARPRRRPARPTSPMRRHLARGHRADSRIGPPSVLNLAVRRMRASGAAAATPVPLRVALVRPAPGDPSQDQLFLDRVPLPRDAWHFDPRDRVLSWSGPFGGGHLRLSGDHLSGVGVIGPALAAAPVIATALTTFLCDVAAGAGVTLTNAGNLVWDTTSPDWANAPWVTGTLQLSYIYQPGTNFTPPVYDVIFTDTETDTTWTLSPLPIGCTLSLQLQETSNGFVWPLTFNTNGGMPIPDDRSGVTAPNGGTLDTVFPTLLQVDEDAAVQTLAGGMLIDGLNPSGNPCGVRGTLVPPSASGYYLLPAADAQHAPLLFGLFDGRVYVDDAPVPGMCLAGDRIAWTRLPAALLAETGLPALGALQVMADGAALKLVGTSRAARRLSMTALAAALAAQQGRYPCLEVALGTAAAAVASDPLTPGGLLVMSPYQQSSQGGLYDAVQQTVLYDMQQIMNSFIPADLWSLLFNGQTQPVLTGLLSQVANTPAPGVSQTPAEFYGSLATAVLTQGLAEGSDPNCQYLNGPRAAAWLQQQVATSPIYQYHTQLLFPNAWATYNPTIAAYLTDQQANAPSYATQIVQQVQTSIAELNALVLPASAPPDALQTLTNLITGCGNYAETNQLYWAFVLYTLLTNPALLANINQELDTNQQSGDGSTLARMIQGYLATLTALDPSGYFANQYMVALQQYLATNVLVSMVDLSGNTADYDLIIQYLNAFVSNNINSTDAQIQNVAVQLQSILAQEDAEHIISDSFAELRMLADIALTAQGLPFISNSFVQWFTQKYPASEYPKLAGFGNAFGAVLMGGVMAMTAYNLFLAFTDWSKMTTAQKAQVVTNALMLGTQFVSAVVKDGLQLYQIFTADGLSFWQRAGAMVGYLNADGQAALAESMSKISNSFARWVLAVPPDTATAAQQGAIDMIERAVPAEETSLAESFFNWSKSLGEFQATVIGPVFMLAGIGFAIYQAIKGPHDALDEAMNALSIAMAAFTIFAMCGEWLLATALPYLGVELAAGTITVICSIAGWLSVVAMVAGLALMLYMMFKKPPDPIATFVSQYASPAGFTAPSAQAAIDYAAQSYANPNQDGLQLVGISVSSSGGTLQPLVAASDGSIGFGTLDYSYATVWTVATNGLGLSQLTTLIDRGDGNGLVQVFLTLGSDNTTVSFQEAGAAGFATQVWYLSASSSFPPVLADGLYASCIFSIQPVLSDANGNYSPSGASGWLCFTPGAPPSVQSTPPISSQDPTPQLWTVALQGRTPAVMTMANLSFTENIAVDALAAYGPLLGQVGSMPTTFALSPASPAFLTFDSTSGRLTASATPLPTAQAPATPYTLSATNALGQTSTTFTITVNPPAGSTAALGRVRQHAAWVLA